MIVRKRFTITGVASTTVDASASLKSTEQERRTLKAVGLNADDIQGNQVQIWIGQTLIFEVDDYFLQSEDTTGGTNTVRAANRRDVWKIDAVLPTNEAALAKLVNGATGTNIRGYYEYEIG